MKTRFNSLVSISLMSLAAAATVVAIGCSGSQNKLALKKQKNQSSPEITIRNQRCPDFLPAEPASTVDPKLVRILAPIAIADGQPGIYRLKHSQSYFSAETTDGLQAGALATRFEREGILAQWDERDQTLTTACTYASSGLALQTAVSLPLAIDRETGLIIDTAEFSLRLGPDSIAHARVVPSLGNILQLSNINTDTERYQITPYQSSERSAQGALALRIQSFRKEGEKLLRVTTVAEYALDITQSSQSSENRAYDLLHRLRDQKAKAELYNGAEAGELMKRFRKLDTSFATFYLALDFFQSLRDPALNDHVFVFLGRRAVEMTFAALEDKNFQLGTLRQKLDFHRSSKDASGKSPATVSEALKKALEELDVDVDVDAILKGAIY